MNPIEHLIEENMALEQYKFQNRMLSRKLKENPFVGVEEMRALHHYESQSRKLKENQFVNAGVVGLVGVCTIGACIFNKRTIFASLHLLQQRVIAEGAMLGSLAGGIGYSLFKNHSHPALSAPVCCFRRLNRKK